MNNEPTRKTKYNKVWEAYLYLLSHKSIKSTSRKLLSTQFSKFMKHQELRDPDLPEYIYNFFKKKVIHKSKTDYLLKCFEGHYRSLNSP